jgi:hypothetical protein
MNRENGSRTRSTAAETTSSAAKMEGVSPTWNAVGRIISWMFQAPAAPTPVRPRPASAAQARAGTEGAAAARSSSIAGGADCRTNATGFLPL